MTGSVGHKRVAKDYLLESEIPLPPLNEQKRIADRLDQLLTRIDKTKAHLDRIPPLLKRFRQSVLAAATSGRLTADWRTRELENKILNEWSWKSLSDVCIKIVDCPHSTPQWSNEGEICLRTTNFRPNFLDLAEVRYVPASVYEERVSRLIPEKDDVLYSREGGLSIRVC